MFFFTNQPLMLDSKIFLKQTRMSQIGLQHGECFLSCKEVKIITKQPPTLKTTGLQALPLCAPPWKTSLHAHSRLACRPGNMKADPKLQLE